MESGRLCSTDETDHAIQTGMVRDGQPGQPEFDRPLNQDVRRGGAIEEREIGVAMEFGIRDLNHGSLRSGAG